MKKLTRRAPELTRQRLANPNLDIPLASRLVRAGAVDLNGNRRIESLGNGYSRVTPIDPAKRFRLGGKKSR